MSKGYIKIYRDLQDCWVWFDDPKFTKGQAWVDLLMLANHQDKKTSFKGKFITVERGQYVTNIPSLSERWGWSYNKTKNFLDLLENDKMLMRKSDNRKTVITIVNYGVYQGADNKKTNDIDVQIDSPINSPINSPTDSPINSPIDTKQERNKGINIYNNIYNPNNISHVHFGTLWNEYIRKEGKSKAFRMYQARLNEGYSEEELLQAVKNYMQECRDNNTEKRYIKLCSTFLGIDKPFTDYLSKGDKEDGNKEPEVGSDEWMELHREQLEEVRKHMPDL